MNPESPSLLDVAAVAAYLSITPRHVRELVYRPAIPHLKVGRLVRFRRADIDGWLDSRAPTAS